MKAVESSFSFIEQESLIEIPFFQRSYVWRDEQWEQLFHDLKESYENKKEHFLGSIILKQLPTNAGDGSKRSLIDGQQRLTTFSILIKVLYEQLDNDDKSDYATYLFKKPTKEKIPKIKHSKFDEVAFNEILRAKNIDSINNNIVNHKNMLDCYKYFTEKIKKVDVKKFLDFILNSKLWVTINLDADEDEQKIFDSINTAGLKLTATDIIKNAIFAKAIEINIDYEKLYAECWQTIFESESNRDFWEQELTTGRLKRVQSEIFLHAFAVIEGFFNPKSNSLEDLSSLYKNHIKKFNGKQLENFLYNIKQYAMIYYDFPHINNETPLCFDDNIKRLFHILSVTDTSTAMPIVLFLSFHLKDKEILDNCLKVIEIFIVTRWLCKRDTKHYNNMFASMVGKIKQNNPLKTLKEELIDVPSKEELQESLKNLNDNKKAKIVLFWIELYRRYNNKDKQDVIELTYQYTLEHLMPISWKEYWGEIVVDEENAENCIYQIGNMTLLKNRLNNAIKNATWNIKLNGDGSRKNSIKKCTDLLITRELLDIKEWNLNTINKRSNKLVLEFFKIWNPEYLEKRSIN